MVDMLFLTDKKNMNFIVNYNMLNSPTEINEAMLHKNHGNSSIDQSMSELEI